MVYAHWCKLTESVGWGKRYFAVAAQGPWCIKHRVNDGRTRNMDGRLCGIEYFVIVGSLFFLFCISGTLIINCFALRQETGDHFGIKYRRKQQADDEVTLFHFSAAKIGRGYKQQKRVL